MLATRETPKLSDRLGLIDSVLASCDLPLTKVTLDFAWYVTSPNALSLRRQWENRKAEGDPVTEEWVREALSIYLAVYGEEADENDGGTMSGEMAARAETVTQTLEKALTRQEEGVTQFAGELREGKEGLGGTDPSAAVDRMGISVEAALARIRETEAELADARNQIGQMRYELENARTEARQDHLTKLANRRAFKAKFTEFTRPGQRSCLAIVDLDRFKAVNDRHGHPVGDRVLKTVADHLTDGLPKAFVSRYGGEEFAILFGNSDLLEALAELEAARKTLHARRLRLKDSNTYLDPLNFSAGLIQLDVQEAYDQAMSRTDALLYEAKANGRGRTFTVLDIAAQEAAHAELKAVASAGR